MRDAQSVCSGGECAASGEVEAEIPFRENGSIRFRSGQDTEHQSLLWLFTLSC